MGCESGVVAASNIPCWLSKQPQIMKLQAKTKEQQERVFAIVGCKVLSDDLENGIELDGFISYEEMAAIVDYLRQPQDKKKELFEDCWKAYNRKGSKKKSLEYWNKLKDSEKELVMPHVKAYVASRELQYQKDFERYLRDKIFMTIVFANNKVVYDPTKLESGSDANSVYMPTCDGALSWNDYYKCFLYVGDFDGKHIADGYDDDNRPNGATIKLNNGRGEITWNANDKSWDRV